MGKCKTPIMPDPKAKHNRVWSVPTAWFAIDPGRLVRSRRTSGKEIPLLELRWGAPRPLPPRVAGESDSSALKQRSELAPL